MSSVRLHFLDLHLEMNAQRKMNHNVYWAKSSKDLQNLLYAIKLWLCIGRADGEIHTETRKKGQPGMAMHLLT